MRRKLRRGYWGYAHKRSKSDKRPVRRRIEIQKSLKGHAKMRTLVHEMMHQLHIGLAERTILQLEDGIVQMVEENPEVFHDLVHELIK